MDHFVYRVTFPGMPWFYYGVHTENGRPYYGSPKTHKWLWDFYEFEFTILARFETREEADSIEARIISHFLDHPDCLNESVAGKFSLEALRRGACKRNQLPVSQETREKISSGNLSSWKILDSEKRDLRLQGLWKGVPPKEKDWVYRRQKETLKRIGHQQKEKNSQFGTMWITDGINNKKIKKDSPIPEGYRKGRTL